MAFIGYSHIGLTVTALDDLSDRLAESGAEFTPKRELPYGWLPNFRDPDNIALEVMLSR
ncbi:hypothetical protein [Nocardia sp. XZ_19_231]|uniref:hypothetical protein n=1 Tax=Nocardia sp. XZ_19_231 TaxID=2769252 RepID=UPI00188E4C00|nr:hypothetical protein [Nocardia sp. XZ_19_231]